MLFFILILICATALGFYILHLDKNYNNILESCSNYEAEHTNAKNSTSYVSKSLLAKENDERTTEEEKRLLHLSRLI
jgi:hypothetical protein